MRRLALENWRRKTEILDTFSTRLRREEKTSINGKTPIKWPETLPLPRVEKKKVAFRSVTLSANPGPEGGN